MVQKLGWFQTTFAMASRTCREVVERVPSTRVVLTEEELQEVQLTAETWTNEPTLLANAVVEGDVEAMEWLIQLSDAAIDEQYNWRHDREVGGRVTSNWVNLLGWLAAKHGKIESLMCLRANRFPCDHDACSGAARGGNLGVLQWARQNGCPRNEDTCYYAALGGHLKVLQWARQNGCPWNEWTCAGAAEYGHLEMLKWARENGCPWDEETCWQAAGGGHLEVLRWARENGCPWDEKTWRSARSNCRRYLIEHGCPGAR